jgi:uroporphyrinogen decarboxylase
MAQFKKDRMTEKERLWALLNRQPIDRVPFGIFSLGFCAATVGYPLPVFYSEPEKSFEAMQRTHEMYDGWHWMFYPPRRFGVKEFGGEIKLPTSEFAQSASVLRSPVQSEEDVWKLEVPDIKTAGIIPLMMQFSRLQAKHGWPVTFFSGSLLTHIGNIAGVDRMCRWMIRKPELVHHLCRLDTDLLIAIAHYWVDTLGHPELMIPYTAAPTEANQVISPQHFKEFYLPYQAEVHQKILDMGIKHINIHVCGEQNLNLPYWAQIPRGEPGLLSFGHEVDLETASKYFPNDIIMGNVEPAIIQTGTPEEVYELSRICIEKGKKHPAGFVLSPGCELPPKSPPYNVWMMRKAINDFGWYDSPQE